MTTMDPRTRRVIAARHRDRDWQAEVDALTDPDSLFYGLSLLREGYGDLAPFVEPRPEGEPKVRSDAEWRRWEYDYFEATQRERLAILIEARPDAGQALVAPWEAWWAKIRGNE